MCLEFLPYVRYRGEKCVFHRTRSSVGHDIHVQLFLQNMTVYGLFTARIRFLLACPSVLSDMEIKNNLSMDILKFHHADRSCTIGNSYGLLLPWLWHSVSPVHTEKGIADNF